MKNDQNLKDHNSQFLAKMFRNTETEDNYQFGQEN